MAALALASDPPADSVFTRKPCRKAEYIINADMFRMISAQAVYQVIICLLINFQGSYWFPKLHNDIIIDTVVFNTFIFCQIFNEINSRSINRGLLY